MREAVLYAIEGSCSFQQLLSAVETAGDTGLDIE